MTMDELKDNFYNYKNAERKLRSLRNRLAEVRSDISAISSALGNIGMPSGSCSDPKIERLMDRLLEVEKKYLSAIDEFMTAEDKLSELFLTADLTAEEKDVIIDAYVYGKPAWKIADEMGWSERTIKNRKRGVVKKLCKE